MAGGDDPGAGSDGVPGGFDCVVPPAP